MRFQITVTYAVFFEPRNTWDNNQYDDTMPITVQANICDVVNCIGKTGTDVMSVLEKQWARLGLSKYDCVGGTGDGNSGSVAAAGDEPAGGDLKVLNQLQP